MSVQKNKTPVNGIAHSTSANLTDLCQKHAKEVSGQKRKPSSTQQLTGTKRRNPSA